MEDQETELFTTEAAEALVLNQKLGLGIAFFQAGTNMFLNRYVSVCFLDFWKFSPLTIVSTNGHENTDTRLSYILCTEKQR